LVEGEIGRGSLPVQHALKKSDPLKVEEGTIQPSFGSVEANATTKRPGIDWQIGLGAKVGVSLPHPFTIEESVKKLASTQSDRRHFVVFRTG